MGQSIIAFPKSIRDEILNYTDDKEHKSFIKLVDSTHTYKIVMGAKNVSKSFGYMINTIWRIVNEPNYCAVWARNLSNDIVYTIKPTFQKALDFLKNVYNIDLVDLFTIYQKVVIYNPTQQAIFFANFELVNSFAGLTLKKYEFDICEVIFDEIQQNPAELGNSIETIYAKQPNDMEFIKQSTILRTKRKPGQLRSMVFLFNVYDSSHWVCNTYIKPVCPFNQENRELLLKQNYLYIESEQLDCAIMRMSRFYVPKSEIDEYQMRSYSQLQLENPKLYDITIAGEPYDLEDAFYAYPFKKYIFDENGIIKSELLFNSEIDYANVHGIIDGYDPGLRDKNGYCRIVLTNDHKIIVSVAKEISSEDFKQYTRTSTTEYLLALITMLNQSDGINGSILAIDSKEDTIIELAAEYCHKNNLQISVCKAIKNKNPTFKIDFNISNRVKFLIECFQKQLIQFTYESKILLDYLARQAFDMNSKRDEKINPEIYDMINACEYAISMIYPIVVVNHNLIKTN